VRLRILDEAEAEMLHAVKWYENQQDGLGSIFLVRVARALIDVRKNPDRHVQVGKRRSGVAIRQRAMRKHPYSIIYEVHPGQVVVLAVAHASRRPNYWRRRKA